MTDRQQELRRQHALLREHLAWLEREMERESAPRVTQPTQAAPVTGPAAIPLSQATALPSEDVEALLNTYAADERHNPESTKRGCLLAFAITLGLLIIGVTAAYFLFYARR